MNFKFNFDTFWNSIEEIIKFENNNNIEKHLDILLENCHQSIRLPKGLDDGYYLNNLYYKTITHCRIKKNFKIYNLLIKNDLLVYELN